MDLIDKQAVEKIIDELLENDNLQASPSVWHGLHMIKQLPSAQPERKGKWIEKYVTGLDDEPNDTNIIDEWQGARCSVCGKYHTTPYRYSFDNYNFCPNCGADMRGEEK